MKRLLLILSPLLLAGAAYAIWLQGTKRSPESPLGRLADLPSLPLSVSEEPWEDEGATVRVYTEDGDDLKVYAASDGRILGVQARFLSRGFAGPATRLGKLAESWWDREVRESDGHSQSQKPAGAVGKAYFYERVANEGLGLKGTRADSEEKDMDRVELEIRARDCPALPKPEADED